MKIKAIVEGDKEIFLRMCKDFYSSGATMRGYNEELAVKTFEYMMKKHDNLWGYFIKSVDDDKYVGYMLLTSYWCNEDGGEIIIVDELYIDPAYRKHGYGQQLLNAAEKRFRGKAVSITLEVLTTNTRAKELYTKLGYADDGFEVMTKRL
jgi:Acetyltransferases